MSRDLSERTALITGASSGMGREIARSLGSKGATLALVARREDRLSELAREIKELGGHAHVITADFLDNSQVIRAVSDAANILGGQIDILINSAGVGRQAKLIDGNLEDWHAMLQVNVMALALATREALKFFPNDGHVINLGSMSGHRVPGRGGFYAATKFAVRAMSEGLRQELRLAGSETRVSAISPGFVDTELLDDYFQTTSEARYDAIDYPILKAEEIAELVLHILNMPQTAEVTDILLRPTGQKT